jgi:hypothetical protein
MLKEVPPVAAGKVQLLLSLNEPQYLLGGKVLIFPEKKIPSFQWLSTISFEKRSWLRQFAPEFLIAYHASHSSTLKLADRTIIFLSTSSILHHGSK